MSMGGSQTLGNDQLCELDPERLRSLVAERARCGFVPFQYQPLPVDDDDAVERRSEQRPGQGLG
jgi:hypothetical protein